MKKLILLSLMFLMFALSGCNRQLIDTVWAFDKAIISVPGGEVIEVKAESWKDYENSDMIQITSTDGKTYLTHSSNVVLIDE